MGSRRKDLEKRAGFIAFRMAEKTFLKKDTISAERTGERLGNLVFRLSKKHRNRALSNLELAFPQMPAAELDALARKVFQHFGRITGDFMKSPGRTDEEVLAHADCHGFEHLDEALAEGKGVILLTGHYGNWERAAHVVAAKGYKLSVVARDANDTDLNRHVLRIRQAHGVEVLSRGNAARAILTKLKKNEVIAILPDQNSGDIFIPFFEKPCGTVTGPASIHQRMGSPMIMFFSQRTGPGEYRMEVHPPLKPVPGFDLVEGMTRAINNALEEQIRRVPEQWLWFHDRWKSARRAGLL